MSDGSIRYRRVLLKVSGSAVAGKEGGGVSSEALDHIGNQILAVRDLGIQVAVVTGGGNIFRGNVAEEWGIERVEADHIGMLGTVINGLFLRGVLTAKGGHDVRVMTALPMSNFAEPYIRLRATHHLEKGAVVVLACGTGQPFVTTDYTCVQRALEIQADAILLAKDGVDGIYTADPNVDAQARRYESVTYDDAIANNLRVMDQSAFILARDYGAPMHVFNFDDDGVMAAICKGENVGTHISPAVSTVISA
jgi:uridylate kinase